MLAIALALGVGLPTVAAMRTGAALPAPPFAWPWAKRQTHTSVRITNQFTTPEGTVKCAAPSSETHGFETCQFTSARLGSMTFYLYLPSGFADGGQFPLVLLLHGGGERGQSGSSAADNASRLLSQQYVNVWSSSTVQRQWPSVVIVPQVMGDARFVDEPINSPSYTLSAQPSIWVARTMAVTEAIQQEYPQIDQTRRYITGISMGAVAVWDITERWPGYFAAVAPLAGAGDPALASRLISLPIWAFQSADDDTIPVAGSRLMVHAIQKAGGHPLYTEYSGVGHDIWNTKRVYANMTFLRWLFGQTNGNPTGGP